jgi:DNA-binding transcriptional MocR family regulator
VGIYPIEPYFSRPPSQAGFLLGYAALPEDVIRDGIRKLAETLDGFETRPPPALE